MNELQESREPEGFGPEAISTKQASGPSVEGAGAVGSPAPSQWAVLELMGHVSLVGEVSEEAKFGTTMGRIDVLQRDGVRVTQYFGGSSVYRMTPCTEEAAREMMKPYVSPRSLQAPARPDDDDETFDDDPLEGVPFK